MRYSKLCVSAIALGAALLATGASAQTYGRLVVFGDSLSDNGNLFRASGGTQPQSPPYAQRFSNGPVFTELLGFPNLQFFGAVTGSVNNAFGGARTDVQANPPSLQVQFSAYTAAGGRFGARNLVTVYGGANDIFQSVQAAAGSPNPPAVLGAVSTTAADNIAALSGRIAAAGAGTVAVFNLPNLGVTPQFSTGPAAQLVDMFGSATFNARLATQVAATAQANASTNFILVDVERANAALRSNPAAFGLTNVTTSCLNPATGAVCPNPDSFLYFDGVHPTAAGHRFLAAVTTDYLYYGARGAATATQAEAALDHRQSALDAALQRLEGQIEGGPELTVTAERGQANEDPRGTVPQSERSTNSLRAAVSARLSPSIDVRAMLLPRSEKRRGRCVSVPSRTLGLDAYLGWSSGPSSSGRCSAALSTNTTRWSAPPGVGPLVHTADRVTGSTLSGKLQAGWRGSVRRPVGLAQGCAFRLRARSRGYNEAASPRATPSPRARLKPFGAEASVRLEAPLGTELQGSPGGRLRGLPELRRRRGGRAGRQPRQAHRVVGGSARPRRPGRRRRRGAAVR
jgi:outer membrane lipase/esterase